MAGAGTNGVAHGPIRPAPKRFRRLGPGYRLLSGAAKTTGGKPFMNTPGTILPPPDYDQLWRVEALDTDSLSKASPSTLMEYLANLSPEISKGLWDYMRLLNPGWEVKVVNVGSEDTPNARGKAIVDELLKKLARKYGSPDVVFGRLHMGGYIRGAYFGELVLDEAGREALDIATPDPASVRFKIAVGPDGKKYEQMGQWQDSTFVPLDEYETVKYIPIDPMPGNPYGRPLVAPAMFSALFLIGMLHDLRRVISQQGWPRVEIAVDSAKILENLDPSEVPTTPEETEKLLQNAIDATQAAYAALEPDDAWIHTDEVEMKGASGLVSANFQGIGQVIEVVERMLVRALKTMPLMLGMTDGVSEANANRQWEITVAGVKALQHLAESMIGSFMEYACRVQGVTATVLFSFAEIRAAEAQRDALTRAQEIENETKLRNEGFIDQEEASQNLVGHPPAEEGPIFAPPTTGKEEDSDVKKEDENPDKGETKAKGTAHWRAVEQERPAHIRSREAFQEHMQRQGWIYQGSVEQTPVWAAQGRSGEHYEPVARLEDERGRVLLIEYDYYAQDVPQH